jgi:hypothetical protein
LGKIKEKFIRINLRNQFETVLGIPKSFAIQDEQTILQKIQLIKKRMFLEDFRHRGWMMKSIEKSF